MSDFVMELLFYGGAFLLFVLIAILKNILKHDLNRRRRKKTNTHVPTRFIALVAACNEEKGIESAIRSLRKQSMIEAAVVVLNNTHDSTPDVLAKLEQEYGNWLHVLKMEHNPHRKSGALNRGFDYINKQVSLKSDDLSNDFIIMTLDADTIVGNKICEKIVEVFDACPHAGGANIQCLLQDLKTISGKRHPSFMQRIWYAFQHIEYTLAMPQKISQHPKTRILAGACTALRLCALQDVKARRGVVWDVDALVEDYDLTRELHRLGWETPPVHAEAYTDAPVDAKTLLKQRRRWYKGTILMLWEDITKKFTWDDFLILLQIGIAPFMFVLQWIVIGLIISSDWRLFFCIPLFITSFVFTSQYMSFHHRRHGQSTLAWVIVIFPLFYLLYIMWNEILYFISIVSSVTEVERKWD